MWFRWLATVRSPRNSAAATSRFVLPSATRAATRSSSRQSLRAGAATDPSELTACHARPACGPDCLEALERGLDRLARCALLACATFDDAEREQRAGAA